MMRVSWYKYKERRLSEDETEKFSWRDLAVQYAKWSDNVRFWERAVSERIERNKELIRQQERDLQKRDTMLWIARSNERRLKAEIERRDEHDRWGGFFSIPRPTDLSDAALYFSEDSARRWS